MNTIKLVILFLILFVSLTLAPSSAFAATTPTLGQASTFSILSSTYTNVTIGTTINGDLGYTTGPAASPTVNGTTHHVDSVYTQAGIDQGAALSALASQPCTFTFAPGAIDLAADTTHGQIGVYAPGVYCVLGAASVGTGGITLNGTGTYIFRINGALTTVSSSVVTLAGGASSCDVFWTPTAATTLGANSTFVGTDIDASGITIGSTVTWTGRALAFGGTVTTNVDTISTLACTASAGTTGGTSGSSSSSSSSQGQAAPCIAKDFSTIPIVIDSKRISPTSISITWGPYAGIETFNIRYGTKNGEWLYNYDFTGFTTVINSLPANAPIWIQVAARDNCSVGTYGEARLVGGPSLPNTGFAPRENTITGYISSFFKTLFQF